MGMIVAVPVIMIMAMSMTVVVMSVPMTVTMATVGADPHHMVMMADLRCANITFIANDLFAVFAQLTVHVVIAGIDLGQTFGKARQYHRMVFEVPGLDKFDIAKLGGNFVGVGVNPVCLLYTSPSPRDRG